MRKADNLPPYCAVVKKSGNLNFLDPSGPAWPVMGVLLEMLFNIVFHREFHYSGILPPVAGCLSPNVLRLRIGLICKNQWSHEEFFIGPLLPQDETNMQSQNFR